MAGTDEEGHTSVSPTAVPTEDSTPPLPEPNKTNPEPVGSAADTTMTLEYDDFGLPIRRTDNIEYVEEKGDETTASVEKGDDETQNQSTSSPTSSTHDGDSPDAGVHTKENSAISDRLEESDHEEEDFKDAVGALPLQGDPTKEDLPVESKEETILPSETVSEGEEPAARDDKEPPTTTEDKHDEKAPAAKDAEEKISEEEAHVTPAPPGAAEIDAADEKVAEAEEKVDDIPKMEHKRDSAFVGTADTNGIGEFSHQQMALPKKEEDEDDDGEWQTMPAFAPYDIYDDDNRLIAREHHEDEDDTYTYAGMGGAGKGYTRVLVDDDAESATSMDDNTNYLFKAAGGTSAMDDEDTRDAVSQMQATKDLLTEGQKIAYVGLTRIELSQMVSEMEKAVCSKSTKKAWLLATEAMKMWSQKIMIRLYTHMDISSAEQIMIEQLSEHGVMSADLTPQLMANARVKNPMAERKSSVSSPRPSSVTSPRPPSSGFASPRSGAYDTPLQSPPAYNKHEGEELPAVRTPSQLPTSDKLDIDLRWTVLCDLFLLLIADSIYDSRSRVLFERVGKALEIDWIDICRFEKKVTEALEMQQQAERENWNEEEHMESRRKLALKKRYIVMGLATVGGGIVIGLSAGLLAPVIGAGLAAGFTTIGVTGTGSFLAGAGGAAIITASSATSGGIIGARAANRRTGSVKTFEYRPLHNNKRVNLIVTISGWMTGKVDDVRLPFSTVDPVMGDIYSVLWEPEMLTSMGDTINILATEVRYPRASYLQRISIVNMSYRLSHKVYNKCLEVPSS